MPPQRRRQRNADESDAEEQPARRRQRTDSEDEAEADSENEMDVDEPSAAQSADNALAKKLIRYAISCEYSRTPIRRDGIKEKVLGNQGRSWKRIFALAQEQLRMVWGMELRELPVKEKVTLQERRKAMQSGSQVKTGSGAYILTSTLPARYRTAAILPPSKIPTTNDEATYTAFYTLIVSLIWLTGGELSEQKLRRHLTRLNAEQNVSSEKTEVTLKKMERQGYIIRRVERPPVGQDGEEIVTWHVGARAKEEIGLDGVIGMVEEVYGGKTPDLERKLKLSLGIRDQPTDGQVEEQADDREETVA